MWCGFPNGVAILREPVRLSLFRSPKESHRAVRNNTDPVLRATLNAASTPRRGGGGWIMAEFPLLSLRTLSASQAWSRTGASIVLWKLSENCSSHEVSLAACYGVLRAYRLSCSCYETCFLIETRLFFQWRVNSVISIRNSRMYWPTVGYYRTHGNTSWRNSLYVI